MLISHLHAWHLLREHQECVFVISVNAPSYQWVQSNPSSSPSHFIALSLATLRTCEESGTEGGRNKDYKMKDMGRLRPEKLCLYNISTMVFLTTSFKVSRWHRGSFSLWFLLPFFGGRGGLVTSTLPLHSEPDNSCRSKWKTSHLHKGNSMQQACSQLHPGVVWRKLTGQHLLPFSKWTHKVHSNL